MEEQIDQSERQLRAHAEIDEEFTGDRLAKDFKQLEQAAGSQRRRLSDCCSSSSRWGCWVRGVGRRSSWARAQGGAAAAEAGTGAAAAAKPGAPGGPARPGAPPGRRIDDDGIPTADIEEIPDGPKQT